MSAPQPRPTPRRSWVEQIMGMPVSVLARGIGSCSEVAAAAVESAFAELRHVDAVFSTYRPDSAVSRINRGETTIAASRPEIRDVAQRCERARELTGGLFDARRRDGTWDPSGLVKGWAVERAMRHITRIPAVDWCLNAGGDVALASRSGIPFTVGIQDPRNPAAVLTRLGCTAGAVATSGTAVRGAHLYDPRTGAAASGPWLSVTVLGASLETADVLATAAFVAGRRWADVIRRVQGYAGVAVAADGTLNWTAISRSTGAPPRVPASSDHDC